MRPYNINFILFFMKNLFFILLLGALFLGANAQKDPWALTGNSGTTTSNFLGTTDCNPLIFKTNNTERMRLILNQARLGIGTNNPLAALHLHYQSADVNQCNDIIVPQDALDYMLLRLSTPITGANHSNGFGVAYSRAKEIIFRQYEQANFLLEGPGGGLTIDPDGNIGIGTTIPKQKLHIVDGNIMISKTSAKNISPNGSIFFGADINDQFPNGKWGIEYLNNEDNSGYGLNFWRPWNPGGGGSFNFGLFLADDGNVGVGKNKPLHKLDVNGDIAAKESFVLNEGAISSLSLGKAYSDNLGWGTSYIGFNAVRNNTTGKWACSAGYLSNGGGIIYATTEGAINFVSIPNTGVGNPQTLTDAQIKQNIKMQLTANGKLKIKEVEVTLNGWPDYVFETDYPLMNLQETEQYIKENKHLPNVPSAAEVEANGVNLGDMQGKLLLKIEELTLYILDLQKQIDELKNK